MAARWSQKRREYSCGWSLLLLLGFLKLFGIAEALILAKMSTGISSLLMGDTKVTSKMGENVTLYFRADFQLSNLSVTWYRLSQHGPNTMVHSYHFEAEQIEDQATEFQNRTSLSIRPGEVVLTLKDVRLQDSGTYKCVVEDSRHSLVGYVILQVAAPKETLQEDDDSLVIYSVVGLFLAGLVVWMISFSVLCKRGDLECPRNWDQEI